MTAGTVVVLGEVGDNVAAGMSGGELYVLDDHAILPLRLNGELVTAERGAPPRGPIEEHARHTGSACGADVLRAWDAAAGRFWRVTPRERPLAPHVAAEAEAASAAAA
jgi:glutamate synthase (ferredoxin)